MIVTTPEDSPIMAQLRRERWARQQTALLAWSDYLTALAEAKAAIPYWDTPNVPDELIEHCFGALGQAEQALMRLRDATQAARS